jgi:hypothetical protein
MVALFALGVQSPALAQTAAHPTAVRAITIQVDSVLAADTNEGVDARLASIGPRLKGMFDYTTYRLLNRQVSKTVCGRMVTFNLPGGRILHVAPHRVEDHMIVMELMLFEGPRPTMATDLKLMNHGMLFIGGRHYEQGMLIISIAAQTPDQPPTPAASQKAQTPPGN